jgi:hypothetical protein
MLLVTAAYHVMLLLGYLLNGEGGHQNIINRRQFIDRGLDSLLRFVFMISAAICN